MALFTWYTLIFLGTVSSSQNSIIFRETCQVETLIQDPEINGKATIEIGKGSGVFFTYPLRLTKLIMQPCDSLPSSDSWFCPEPVYSRNWKVAELQHQSGKAQLTLYFSPGPSADPEFILVGNSGEIIGRIPALKLEVTEDFQILSSGHTNTMFDKKRFYNFSSSILSEVKQAYYDVRVKGKLNRDVEVFCDESFATRQQVLLIGSEIEILLAKSTSEEDFYEKIYLIRSETGIIGYIRLTDEDTFGGLIDGLYYAGD